LPFLQESNKNVNVLFGSYQPYYEDNCSYEKTISEQKAKQYKNYIEKAMLKFEKVERATPLGKETYWLNKNEKYASGVYIMLEEFALSDNYFIKIRVRNDKDMTRERIEKMK
jgi:uncharacterized HAD superfamily protein